METINVKVQNQNIQLKQGARADGGTWVMTEFLATGSWNPGIIMNCQIGSDKRQVIQDALAGDGTIEIESKQFNQRFNNWRITLPKQTQTFRPQGTSAPSANGGSRSYTQNTYTGRKLSPEEYFDVLGMAAEEIKKVIGGEPVDAEAKGSYIDSLAKLIAQFIICLQQNMVVLPESPSDKFDFIEECKNASTIEQATELRDKVLEHKTMVAAEKLALLHTIKKRIEALQNPVGDY